MSFSNVWKGHNHPYRKMFNSRVEGQQIMIIDILPKHSGYRYPLPSPVLGLEGDFFCCYALLCIHMWAYTFLLPNNKSPSGVVEYGEIEFIFHLECAFCVALELRVSLKRAVKHPRANGKAQIIPTPPHTHWTLHLRPCECKRGFIPICTCMYDG